MKFQSSLGSPFSQEPFFAQTILPTEHGDFEVRIFKEGEKEHLAISVGELKGAERLPTRVHSECFTGEVLGSLKCDCKAQLNAALAFIQEQGQGLVIYLRQEGRGIGLGNKIRAYQLQEQGADTVDANRLLGFADDLREYDVAGEILQALNVQSVLLLTNNPDKLSGLAQLSVQIAGRIPLITGINAINCSYLETKRQRMGHLIEDLNSEHSEAINKRALQRPKRDSTNQSAQTSLCGSTERGS